MADQEAYAARYGARQAIFVRTDGSDSNDGTSWANAKLTPKTVIEGCAANSGIVVVLGPGTFTLDDSGGLGYIEVPAGLHVVGCGLDVTTIASAHVLGSLTGHAIVRPGNNSIIEDLTVSGTASAAQIALGTNGRAAPGPAQAPFVNAVVRRCRISAYAYGIWMYHGSACSAVFEDCLIEGSNYPVRDYYGALTVFDFRRCRFVCSGGWANVAALQASYAKYRLCDCVVEASAGNTTTDGVVTDTSGIVELLNCKIQAGATGGTVNDLRNSAGTINAHNCIYATSSGTIGSRNPGAAIAATVNHAAYGNAQLLRSTTPANTLSVASDHSVAATAAQANGNLRYVRKSGNDTTGDGSSAAPWLTLNKAITSVTSGDVINVGPGTYAETNSAHYWALPAGFTRYVTVQSETGNADDVTITAADGTSYNILLAGGVAYVKFKNVTLTSAGSSQDVIRMTVADHICFDHCKIVVSGTTQGNRAINAAYSGTDANGTTNIIYDHCRIRQTGTFGCYGIWHQAHGDTGTQVRDFPVSNVSILNCDVSTILDAVALIGVLGIQIKGGKYHSDGTYSGSYYHGVLIGLDDVAGLTSTGSIEDVEEISSRLGHALVLAARTQDFSRCSKIS